MSVHTGTERKMKTFYEFLLVSFILINSQVEAACPEGYCRHSGGCYLIVELNETWINARSYCTVLGGSLLSITSSTQQAAAEGALRRSKGLLFSGGFWLDVTDLLNPKDWREMGRRSLLSYRNWATADGSPNNTTQGNCVYMSETFDYRWKPAPCDRKMNFVCYSSGSRRSYSYNRYGYESDDDVDC